MIRGFLLFAALALVPACGHQIGDACHSNVDCSPLGDRFCDTGPVNGYCTIDGCDQSTCPSEAVCIRFFTPLANEPCTFDLTNARSNCPHTDERCVCDQSSGDKCLNNNSGHCAPESSERRWCQKQCSSDGDCRSGYQCRQTGTFGAEPVPTFDSGTGGSAKFCAPTGQPAT
jgi:hypothetical protein